MNVLTAVSPDLKHVPAGLVAGLKTAFAEVGEAVRSYDATRALFPTDAEFAAAVGGEATAAEMTRLRGVLGNALTEAGAPKAAAKAEKEAQQAEKAAKAAEEKAAKEAAKAAKAAEAAK